jgi:hypothetical protein
MTSESGPGVELARFRCPARSQQWRSAVQGDHPPSPGQAAAPEPIRFLAGGESCNRRRWLASLLRGFCLFRVHQRISTEPDPLIPCMPWTVCPRERRCFEPSPLVKARAQLPAGHRCCPLLSPASCPRHAPRAPSPQDDRGPWPPLPAIQAHGDVGGSPVPGPTLGGDSSTGRGCTGRAGCRSRRRRRCARCQSSAPAARSSGRGVFPPLAPSCFEHPRRQSKLNLACPATPRASIQLDTLCARENRGGPTTCDTDHRELLSWGVGCPILTGVVPDARDGCGPDVTPAGRPATQPYRSCRRAPVVDERR